LIALLKSYNSFVCMQALDNFISPIPSFEGDIPIPAIPVSARSPSDDYVSDPSAGASAGASKTRAGKQKATTKRTPKKTVKKATGKSSGGIKINKPTPKAVPAPTPPSNPRQRIPIHRSNRYTCHYAFLKKFLIAL
jgi:hypothetical protein